MTVREHFNRTQFTEDDNHFQVLWRQLDKYHQEYGRMPATAELVVSLKAMLSKYRDVFTTPTRRRLLKIVRDSEFITPEMKTDWASRTAQRFLEENLLAAHRNQLEDDELLPANLAQYMQDVHTAASTVMTVGAGGSKSVFAKVKTQKNRPPVVRIPTGIDYLDYYTDGGMGKGQIGCIRGPFKSAKTTHAVQLLCRSAERAWSDPDKKTRGVSYFFGFEDPVDPDILIRTMACCADIPKDRLEKVQDWEGFTDLADGFHRQEYELKRYGRKLEAGVPVLSERERAKEAFAILERHTCLVDMGGNDEDFPARGGGGMPELASIIRSDMSRDPSMRVDLIVIDHAMAWAQRHMLLNSIENTQANETALLRLLVRDIQVSLSTRFGCPVWITHQVAGADNGKGPGFFGKSMGCTSFDQNVNYSFTLSEVTPETSLLAIAQTVTRHTVKRLPKVLKLDGAFCQVREDQYHVIDNASKKFAPKSSGDRIQVDDDENEVPVNVTDDDDSDAYSEDDYGIIG